jgi:hypothetical protein
MKTTSGAAVPVCPIESPRWSIKVAIWTPAAFCAFLSIMKMFAPNDTGAPAFYSFLPMCFFFAGGVHFMLLKRIEAMEAALGDAAGQEAEATDA